MNEIAMIQEVEKQGIVKRFLTAVLEKSFAWFSEYPLGLGTPETMMFMNYIGIGMEEALTYQSITHIKFN